MHPAISPRSATSRPRSFRPPPPPGPYLVVGLGVAGWAAAETLVEHAGPSAVRVWDAFPHAELIEAGEQLRARGVVAEIGGDGIALLDADPPVGSVVKSPGVPFDAPVLAAAHARGVPIVDEAELAWRLDDRPLVGITGTNGKSTSCALVERILGAAGARPLLGGNAQRGPALSALRRYAGDVLVAELSSFQLEGCPALLPEAAVFTNLTHDHLYRHGDMERYAKCKRRLFIRDDRSVPLAAVNVDDRVGAQLAGELRSRGSRVVGFGEADADFRLRDARWSLDAGELTFESPEGELQLDVRLPGRHNALNVLGALALAHGLGIAMDTAGRAVSQTLGVPGRFERVTGVGELDVIVDYAHNPDGVRQTLETAREVLAARPGGGRLRVVASALALLDEGQRRAMGGIARSLSDDLVLTAERWWHTEPLNGPPLGLVEGALEAAGGECEVVTDRRSALERVLCRADPGDVVVILGRGAHTAPLYDESNLPRPFDDRIEARRAWQGIAGDDSRTRERTPSVTDSA